MSPISAYVQIAGCLVGGAVLMAVVTDDWLAMPIVLLAVLVSGWAVQQLTK